MAGDFGPNLTFGPKMVADLHKTTRLPLDVHLMIERPEDWIDRYVDAGAAYVVVHIEAVSDARGAPARIPPPRAPGRRPRRPDAQPKALRRQGPAVSRRPRPASRHERRARFRRTEVHRRLARQGAPTPQSGTRA